MSDTERPLVPVTKSNAAPTVEEALDRFEDACSTEIYEGVRIIDRTHCAGGILVRYEVRWKHSVFDDSAYGAHDAAAIVRDEGAPADARFRVVAATRDHHLF